MNEIPFVVFIKQHIPNIVVSDDAINKIVESFEEREIVKNDHLLKAGKVGGYFYLQTGFMRAYTHDPDGLEVTTYFYPNNRVVFEASSFFLSVPSTENIQAVTDCMGYFTTFDKLNNLFHSVPEFREFGRATLVKEFIFYKQRTLSMINKNAEERYAELINTNNEIFQFAQLKHIASYLAMTDTSLSRIRRELSKK